MPNLWLRKTRHKPGIWPDDKFFLQLTSAHRGCCAGLINNHNHHLAEKEIVTLLAEINNNVVA